MSLRIFASLVCFGVVACSYLSTQETTRFQALSSTRALSNFTNFSSHSDSLPSDPEHIGSSQLEALAVNAVVNSNRAETVAVSADADLDIPSLHTTTWTHEILQTRKYHGDEVTAASGEQWWGLFVTDKGFELLPTTIAVNTVQDVILDPEDGEFTGKEVVTDEAFQSVFLVKGPIPLEAGVVKTVFFGLASIPEPPQADRPERYMDLRLSLDGSVEPDLRLSLDASAMPDLPTRSSFNFEDFTWNERRNVVLTFFSRNQSKTQKYNIERCCDTVSPRLIWAGDLDRDGKLDFLLDTTTHYNVSEPILFLSSPAQVGEIVRPVARIRSVGC